MEDGVAIKQIPLSVRQPQDIIYWWPSKDGIYTTKTSYWLGRLNQGGRMFGRNNEEVSEVWRKIWNLGGPPKLSHLLWRACIDILIVMALAWASWAYRNSIVFNQPWPCATVGAAGFVRMVTDYQGYVAKVTTQGWKATVDGTRADWAPPSSGVARVNTDAAILEGTGVGMGAVIRDEEGRLLMGVRRREVDWDTEVAEAMAARFGVEMAAKLGFESVELESDSSNLINKLKHESTGLSPIFLVIEDICHQASTFNFFGCNHVRKCGNTVPHYVARLRPEDGNEQIMCHSFP
ncbi:hypothetical protein RDABS01_013372 [Bienertia sinuspersici]